MIEESTPLLAMAMVSKHPKIRSDAHPSHVRPKKSTQDFELGEQLPRNLQIKLREEVLESCQIDMIMYLKSLIHTASRSFLKIHQLVLKVRARSPSSYR
jgi:hypothetical protein